MPADIALSILIVNWNTRDRTLACINSIRRFAPGPEVQVIVIDNGSEDGSVEAFRDSGADVEIIEPQPKLPDMVFTANAGAVYGNKAVASHFMPKERRPEEPYFKAWFRDNGFELLALDEALAELGRRDERLERLVECRFFGGMTMQDTAETLGVSLSTAERDWRRARAYLFAALS